MLVPAAHPGLWQWLWLLSATWGLLSYLRWLWLARHLRQHGLPGCGRVMNCQRTRGVTYEVHFFTHTGRLVQARHEVAYSSDPAYVVGYEARLRYDEQRPARFLLEGELTIASHWVVAGLAGFWGLLLLAGILPLLQLLKWPYAATLANLPVFSSQERGKVFFRQVEALQPKLAQRLGKAGFLP